MKGKKGVTTVQRLFFIILIATIALAGNANAATISVKQLGCEAESACYTTITNGIFYASDGDTVKVYPGTYSESITINKNIKLEGSGPQWTTIYGTNDAVTVSSIVTTTISGFTIRSASGNGIYMIKSSTLNVTIKNNYIVSNAMYGIRTDTSIYGGGVLSIINNVISYNAQNGVYGKAYGSVVGLINNIISNNGGYGIAEVSSNSYNNVYSNVSGNYYSGIVAGTGNLSVNPLFIDAANGNYALQSTSPCKNAGSPGPADNDPDGTRNDMGAFGGPDAASFWPYPLGAPIITNLTATPSSVPKGATMTINATGEVK
jgi:hypothetical protein